MKLEEIAKLIRTKKDGHTVIIPRLQGDKEIEIRSKFDEPFSLLSEFAVQVKEVPSKIKHLIN